MLRLLAIIAISLAVAVSAVYVFDLPLSSGLGRIIHPVGGWLQQAGNRAYSAVGELPRLGRLQTDLRDSRAELTDLRLRLVESQRLEEENRQLREELDFSRDYEPELLAADIVNYQPITNRDHIRIAAGSDDGLSVGMPVITRGVLLGQISHVEPRYSEVILISDIDFRALAEVSGNRGVLKGQIGNGVTLERLDSGDDIDEGEPITTSGRDGELPPGLLVGTVKSVEQTTDGVFNTVNVAQEVDIRDLTMVMVITDHE